MKAKNIFDKRQEQISIKTLKMPDAIANISGQTKEEAIIVLKKLGYSDKEIKKLSENSISTKMNKTKIREFVRGKIIEFLVEKKVLFENSEKEGNAKPTSGMKKEKVGDIHTEKTKSQNPPAKKVTDGGPANKTLAFAEPTPVGNETKVMKEKESDKKVDTDSNFEIECMGSELKVKGASYANINYQYLIGQVKKSLEGRGPKVLKITIEMGEPIDKNSIKESRIRDFLKKIIEDELNKK